MSYQSQEAVILAMYEQAEIYRPSAFWSSATELLMNDFEEHGMENFRQAGSPLRFFVPTYGYPANGLSLDLIEGIQEIFQAQKATSKQQFAIDHFLSGEQSALADYRTLISSNQVNQSVLSLLDFSESAVGNPKEHFEFEGKFYSRSALNYLLGLSFLQNYTDFTDINTVLEIGGGFGTLGEVLLKTSKSIKYIDVDIPPTCFAAEYYLKEVFGENKISDFQQTKSLNSIENNELNRASVLCSWQIEKLVGQVDLFVNFISFQEMEPQIVKNYLSHVNRLQSKWILLRNMREGKQKKTATSIGVDDPILRENYIEMLSNYELVASNVIPFGYKTVDGFHSELMLFKRS